MRRRWTATVSAPLTAFRTAYTAFHPPRPERRRRPDQFGLQAEELTIISGNGRRRISGWLFRGGYADRVLLLGHGLGQEKSRSLPYARFLHRAGYTVLLFDFRNHGGSFQDRGFTGFDRKFCADAVAVARHVRAMPGYAGARLALYGFSLSSFAMLRALGRLHPAVDAVVCDSGPAGNPPAISPNLMRQGLLPLPEQLRSGPAGALVERSFAFFNRFTMGAAVGWPPSPAKPGYATTPMLFIGGGADAVVPAEEILRLARPYPYAETLTVPEARHLRALWTDKERYTSTVLGFLNRCFTGPDGSGRTARETSDPTRAVR